MSKFIKRHEEIVSARCQARQAARAGSGVGFTEAELEAAQWARKLPEVQMQISRRTNGDLRGGKGILATSRKPSSRATEVVSLGEEKSKTDGETSKKRAKAKEKHKESKKHKDDRATEAERERSLGATEGCVPQSDTKKEEKKEKKDKKAKNPMDKKDKIERKRLKKERKEKRKSERKGTEKARGKKERKREKIEKEKERKKAKSGTEKAVENDTDALDPLDPSSHLEAKALEMKMRRKLAKEMRREQRRLKREEHERLRKELAEADDWHDAIGQLIEAAEARSKEVPEPQEGEDAGLAPTCPPPALTPSFHSEPSQHQHPEHSEHSEPAPFRTLEQLVKELDELERLRKAAKQAKRSKPEDAEDVEGDAPDAPGDGDAQPGPVPNDPMNPLNAAYDMRAYELLRKLRLDEEHQISQIALDEPDWDHLGYLRRSPSPCRLRTKGTMWPTRKGAWRSRAGGVYLPPELNPEKRGSPSLSPARWMYPEEFNRPLQKARRSPSYERFEREEISTSSSSSSSSSSSTIPKKRKKRNVASSESRLSRPSPTYD
ncbi:unnamed protein product [Durusdinium trenchii]|uniref:Uncharacterized protein n=2 Tax=Durusdinium trenchii TaxID=1381693 RepID=A0ABP0S016_9DINO